MQSGSDARDVPPGALAPSPSRPRALHVDRLQVVVADLVDLALQAKQARWNAVGSDLRALHEWIDRVVDVYREWSEVLGYRMVELGGTPDCRPASVAAHSRVAPLASGWLPAERVHSLFATRMRILADHIEEELRLLPVSDTGTRGILVDIVADLNDDLRLVQGRP